MIFSVNNIYYFSLSETDPVQPAPANKNRDTLE